jgi:hypothetical protein
VDEPTIRTHAQAMADALVEGDVERALTDLSPELRRNMGEVVALLPLPATEATVEAVDATGSGWTAVVRMVGESEENTISTRWKDRDGRPTLIEVSHLSRQARAPEQGDEAAAGESTGEGPTEAG